MAILFQWHLKFWVIVQNTWFIPHDDVRDESLPSVQYQANNCSKASFLLIFISFIKNFGTQLAHNRLYTRPFTNLLMVAKPTPVVQESSLWVIGSFLRIFLSISAQISAFLCSFRQSEWSWSSNLNFFFGPRMPNNKPYSHTKNIHRKLFLNVHESSLVSHLHALNIH